MSRQLYIAPACSQNAWVSFSWWERPGQGFIRPKLDIHVAQPAERHVWWWWWMFGTGQIHIQRVFALRVYLLELDSELLPPQNARRPRSPADSPYYMEL